MIFAKLKRQVIGLINRAINSISDSQSPRSLSQIKSIFEQIKSKFVANTSRAVTAGAVSGRKKTLKAYKEKSKIKFNISIVLRLTDDARQAISSGLSRGLQEIEDFIQAQRLMKTSSVNITDDTITSIFKRSFKTKSINTVARAIKDEIIKQIGKGNFVVVVGKTGKVRHYKPETYAKMVARTKAAEAQSLSVIDTVQEFGGDLVKFSSHNTKTPICKLYEGKIFSISGSSKKYPKLDRISPLHPFCQHRLLPYVS